MKLRVRSLDGAEIVLEVLALTVRVQVAEIKRRAITELLQLRAVNAAAEDTINEAVLARRMTHSYLAFRGQLLADADDVNLFALEANDFFVLIEESREEEEEEDVEVEDPDEETKSDVQPKATKRRTQRNTVEVESVVMQLVEMGFEMVSAQNAANLTNGDLPKAIALLMGEITPSTLNTRSTQSKRLQTYVNDLVRRYPELAAIESLLQHEQVHMLKEIASRNGFEALVMLKESFPAHWMTQMNEHPDATALFLAVPDQYERATVPPSRSSAHESPAKTKRAKLARDVDLTIDASANIGETSSAMDQDAIDRLTAMGFASDLVVAILESCGGNEELAANLLFETLS